MPTATTDVRTADVLARVVRAGGTRFAFGHPGGEVVTLIDALQAAGIRFVLTHHETEAAFMAAGYGEITGIPGVCVSTLGPGATNMLTGVAGAALERAPLLALTGSLAEAAAPGTTHQQLQLNEMYGAIAKASFHIDGSSDVAATTANALRIALDERPGPVHISIPADIAQAKFLEQIPSPQPDLEKQPPARYAEGAMQAAEELLNHAQRPAIVLGLSALRGRAGGEILQLAEVLRAPVITTPKAKGVMPETHPLFLGVIDMAGDSSIAALLDSADLIIAIGCDVVELDRRWTWNARVIHVDRLSNADGYYSANVELVGDIAISVSALAEKSSAAAWPAHLIAATRAEMLDRIQPSGSTLQPWEVVAAVRGWAQADAIATCDVGAHKMLVGQLWTTAHPRTFFMSNGLSSMGFSLPTALAASLVQGEQQIIAFVGDGGLGMYLGELETLQRLKASVTVVVFADQSLELIRRAEIKRGVATGAVSFRNPDFAHVGAAFGIPTWVVDSRHDLEAALLSSSPTEPMLIAALIDGHDYVL